MPFLVRYSLQKAAIDEARRGDGMTDLEKKAEDWAKQLTQMTEAGKIAWSVAPETLQEEYRAEVDEGYSFSIKKRASGDNKFFTFELTINNRVIISEVADNVRDPMGNPPLNVPHNFFSSGTDAEYPRISRFRAFSDLFQAARTNAIGGAPTIQKVDEILQRLGSSVANDTHPAEVPQAPEARMQGAERMAEF